MFCRENRRAAEPRTGLLESGAAFPNERFAGLSIVPNSAIARLSHRRQFMGRSLASCRDRKRTVSRKRYSAGAARPAKGRKRDMEAAEKTATRSANIRRRLKPHRSEADLDLARRMLAALRSGADMRLRKVRRLKAAIKVRAYENNLKFQVAFDRLRAAVLAP